MIVYQFTIVALIVAALIGLYLLKTRLLQALVMAATSGVLALLCRGFYRMIA